MAVTEQSRSPALSRRLSPLLTIASRTEGADTIVALHGESDFSTTTSLSDALAHVVAVDAGDVVIDLTALTFLDSATVRAFARLQELLAHHDRALTVRSPSPTAGRILDLFGLTDLIEAPDVADAATLDDLTRHLPAAFALYVKDARQEEGTHRCTSESERSS